MMDMRNMDYGAKVNFTGGFSCWLTCEQANQMDERIFELPEWHAYTEVHARRLAMLQFMARDDLGYADSDLVEADDRAQKAGRNLYFAVKALHAELFPPEEKEKG